MQGLWLSCGPKTLEFSLREDLGVIRPLFVSTFWGKTLQLQITERLQQPLLGLIAAGILGYFDDMAAKMRKRFNGNARPPPP